MNLRFFVNLFKKHFHIKTMIFFQEEDVNKIIEEKNRFRAHPTNYAMKKTQLLKVSLNIRNVFHGF